MGFLKRFGMWGIGSWGPGIRAVCILWVIVLAMAVPSEVEAQKTRIRFDRISLEEGLSQATVWTITQDRQGFLWFGTADGLNKYDGYRFTVYTHDPQNPTSLSDNRIYTIYEDRSGTLWIGTSVGGLNRFDRKKEEFVHYHHDPSDPHSLSNDRVMSVYEDRQGILWVGTSGGGLDQLDRQTQRFRHYRHDPDDPHSLSNNYVFPIREDRNGNLWVGTADGLNLYDRENDRFFQYKHDSTDANSLSHDLINAIHEDRSGNLWIGTDDGLNRLVLEGPSDGNGQDDQAVRFVRYKRDPSNPKSLSSSVIWAIYEDRASSLWVGTSAGGLNRFEPGGNTFLTYKNDPYDPNSLSNNSVRSIYEDDSGALWVGTNSGGLNRLSRLREKFLHYRYDPLNENSLSSDRVYAIFEDHLGDFWIGTVDSGLNRLDRETEMFTDYKSDPADPGSLSENSVLSIYEDRAGTLWVGTFAGGVNRFDRRTGKFFRYKNDPADPHSLSDDRVRAIIEDRSGKLWLGTYGGLNMLDRHRSRFTRYRHDPDDPNSLSNDRVRCLFEDSAGRLWVGTYGGLNRFEPESESFVHYRHDPGVPNSLSNNSVLSIYEDASGAIWVGTFGGGLNRLDVAAGKFTYFSEKDGLPNNVVCGILGDSQGNLWLSTNKGLSKFNPKARTFRNYDVNDGLQSNEFNTGAYFKSRNGELAFGGINGFNLFRPELIKDDPYVPAVVITAVKKFGEAFHTDISDSISIEISYRDKYLEFEFVALDYRNPQKNRYAYIMEGFDDDWTLAGPDRDARYTNLDPGEYVFRVKGSSSDGVWNEEGISVRVVVRPPFWREAWFISLCGVSLLGIGFVLYRVRVNSKLAKARILNELAAARDMQMGLLPRKDPQIEGFDISGVCRPAEIVGGDYFDYIWLDEARTRLGIALVDVSDKAMKGAMIAVMASGMVNREVGSEVSARTVLEQINPGMCLKTDRRVFTAMSFAVIDTQRQTLTLANAGQPEPLLQRNGDVRGLRVEGARLPLGLKENVTYQETTIGLLSEDLLVFYTDGLPEAMNENKELFDFERMESFVRAVPPSLPAAQVVELLLGDVDRFTRAATPHDDITVVVVRVGAPASVAKV